MEESLRRTTHGSFFHNLRSRELNGSRVRKPADTPDYKTEATDEEGAIAVEHDGMESPLLALSFCKTSRCSHILAVSDEDGYVSLLDTRKKLLASVSHQDNADKARIGEWAAHQNAMFDISCIKVAGGDGPASWLLGVISDLKLPRPPPVATVPLGTGNNLPFSFGWGKKNPGTDVESVQLFLHQVSAATEIKIDSWHIIMRMKIPQEGPCDPIAPLELPHSLHVFQHVSSDDKLSMIRVWDVEKKNSLVVLKGQRRECKIYMLTSNQF